MKIIQENTTTGIKWIEITDPMDGRWVEWAVEYTIGDGYWTKGWMMADANTPEIFHDTFIEIE